MKKLKKPSFKPVCVIPVIVAVVALWMGIRRATEIPLERAAGGTYVGDIPGLGKVQFDIFPADPWSTAWLYREGTEETGEGALSTNASGEFRVDVVKDHDVTTNETLTFKLTADGRTMSGFLFAVNRAFQSFALTRLYQYYDVHKHSGLLFHRLGAYADASAQIPLLPMNSAFDVALNRTIAKMSRKDVLGYTSGNFRRQWEILRYGPRWVEGRQDDEWQVRLLTDKLASLAVWRLSDPGGVNGDLTSWSGHTFCWRDGRIHELKLPDLFLPEVDWKAHVRRLCCEDLQRQQYTSESTAVLDEDVSVEEFTISSTGLQIYFSPYTIASGGNGEYVIHIPYKVLQPYLRPEWLAALAPSLAVR